MPVVYTGAIKRSANRRNRFRATLRRQIHSRWSCSIEQIQNTECKTETSNDVTEQASTQVALTADGNFTLFDYQVNHVKTEFKVDVLEDTLRDTLMGDG
jgi:hypothetical protein